MSSDGTAAVLVGPAKAQADDVKTRVTLPIVTNLFDPHDPDCAFGYYPLYTSGALLQNVGFNTTGFIAVEPGQTYQRIFQPLDSSQSQTVRQGQVSYYAADKTFVSGDAGSATNTFVIPAGCYFVRVAVPVANWWDFVFYKGLAAGNFWTPPSQREQREWPSHFQIGTLRQTRLRAANLLMGTVAGQQLVINLFGDSYFHGATRCTTALANYLISKLGDAGGGYVGFGFLAASAGTPPWTAANQPSNLNGNARPSIYPCRLYGNPTATYYTAPTCDSASATLVAAGDAVEVDLPALPAVSAIKLHYVASAAGSIRYTLNGGTTWTALSVAGTAGATAVVALSLTGLTQPGTLRIEWVSGSAQLGGVDLQSSAQGVRVNKIAATGIALTNWQQLDAAKFQVSFGALGGHLTIVEDGRNSQAAGTQASVRDNQLREIINRVRGKTSSSSLGNMAMDVLIYTPQENVAVGNVVSMASYARSDRRRALQARCAHIDGQVSFGFAEFASEYGSAGDVPLLNPDGIHDQPGQGGALMAVDLIKAIMPFDGSALDVKAQVNANVAVTKQLLGQPGLITTFGDSLINGGYAGNSFVTRGLRNSGRYHRGENFAVGGTRTDQFIANQLPSVLAAGRRIAIFDGSTNDIAQSVLADGSGGTGGTPATGDLAARVNLKKIVAALLNAGIMPVSVGNFASSNSYVFNLAQHEIWRQIWAMKTGLPHVHVFSKLCANDGTGAYASGYGLDPLHPNSVGADIAGAELIKVLDNPRLIAQIGELTNHAIASDLIQNVITFGGVGAALPSPFSARGSGASYSVEAPSDGSYGNWLKATYNSAVSTVGFDGRNLSLATLGWAPGDKIAVAFRVKTVAAGEQTLKGRFAFTGTANITTLAGWPPYYDEYSGAAGNDMMVYYEVQVDPAAQSTDTVRPTWTATTTGTATQSMAIQRPLIYNLTANGLA